MAYPAISHSEYRLAWALASLKLPLIRLSIMVSIIGLNFLGYWPSTFGPIGARGYLHFCHSWPHTRHHCLPVRLAYRTWPLVHFGHFGLLLLFLDFMVLDYMRTHSFVYA